MWVGYFYEIKVNSQISSFAEVIIIKETGLKLLYFISNMFVACFTGLLTVICLRDCLRFIKKKDVNGCR